MVLKYADVVVTKGHFVTGVDEEDVAEAGVVGVMHGAGEVHAAAVEGGELAEGFELADFEEVEGGLGDVGCVGFVVVGDLVVVTLNCQSVFSENERVDVEGGEEVFLHHHKINRHEQLIPLRLLRQLKNTKL